MQHIAHSIRLETREMLNAATLYITGAAKRRPAGVRLGLAWPATDPISASVDEVIQWNKILLTIVRTPGAQPATVHATHSFAILHGAIYDAVNAIDATHEPFLIRLERVSPQASQEAAASSAAHEVLLALYPMFQTQLDTQLEQSLAQIPDGKEKTLGIDVGKAVAQATLIIRMDDGSAATPVPYVFGTAPGDYQSTPPNFPKQPAFTQIGRAHV